MDGPGFAVLFGPVWENNGFEKQWDGQTGGAASGRGLPKAGDGPGRRSPASATVMRNGEASPVFRRVGRGRESPGIPGTFQGV